MNKKSISNKDLVDNESYQKFVELKDRYETPIFLTLEKAADYLGFKPSYMYKLTHRRLIPFYKPTNKKIYFLKSDLDKWVMTNKFSSQAELKEQANIYLKNK